MIRYFDMFAGIGGFRAGLTQAGGFRCVGHCEIDKYAHASYCAIHSPGKEEIYYPDARTIDPGEMPDFELLCGGFPCQSFSQAGRRRGFQDPRGTLFFEIARLAQARRPPYLLLENVPGLLSHDKGQTFTAILHALHDLGYFCEWMVLNSADFGVPQSRRRVFLVGYLDPRCAGKILPVPKAAGKAPVQILDGPQGYRVYDVEGASVTQTSQSGGGGGKTGLYFIETSVPADQPMMFIDLTVGKPKITPLARCLTARYSQTTLCNHNGERSGVLCLIGDTVRCGRVRRLMPRECLRLQGFAEDHIDRLLAITSDAQAYKQAGNSVTVNVIEAIGRNLRAMDAETRGENT